MTYTISGQVTYNSSGLSGVTMNGLPGTPTTDSSGNYSATVSSGWSGTVTPSRSSYTFSPSNRPYSSVTSNQAGQNFTGTPTIVALSVTPSTGLNSSGCQGGPFSSSSETYTLQNTGTGSLNWTAGKGQTWVTLSKTGGTLSTGATDTVTVSINNSANSLAVGSHNDTVTFTNTTNGNGSTTRPVILTVSPPPTLMVTSSTDLNSSGFQGGPFSPVSVVYTLQNIGTGSLDWTAGKGQTWVTLSKTGGMLSPGATDTVTVSINNSANSLVVGGYTDAVTFANTNNTDDKTTRAVSLTVNLVPTLTVTPDTGLTSIGLQGGPFVQPSATYTLRNIGIGNLDWTAGKGQTWVTLSKTSGTLSSGATDTVMVSINSSANGLVVGGYSDTVTFTNTTNGNGNATQAVSLTVNLPPMLTVTPGTGLSSSGVLGGPFDPGSVVYTLQNTGAGGLNWTAGKGQTWVTLSKTGGTLSAGATDSVMVSINNGATSLGVGGYSDTVTFTNATNGNGNTTRPVALTVTPTPVKPVIAAIPDASVKAPNAYSGPTPSLTLGTPPVTWSLDASPSGMTINSTSGVVSWPTSSTTGSPYAITIKATNIAGSGTQTWHLTVTPAIAYTLSVQSNPDSQASISVTDPKGRTTVSLTNFSQDYEAGSYVTITAPQALGDEDFVKWMLDGSQYSTGLAVTVQMDAAHTLVAVYEVPVPQPSRSKCGASGSDNLPIFGMICFLGLMLTRRFVGARR